MNRNLIAKILMTPFFVLIAAAAVYAIIQAPMAAVAILPPAAFFVGVIIHD